MTSVTIKNIIHSYGNDAPVLKGIDLKIKPGELFFLLGPSGCGKSTLLRILAGFLTPDSGNILIGDEDVTKMKPEKRETGMVFQSYALWPHMTVFQNVAFGLDVRKVPAAEQEKRVMDALAMVGLETFRERPIPALSGGQQQRVALARALVIRPRVLLLDEPLSNLDAKLRINMRSEIRRICKETGLTTIYVTHDQKEALSMADRLAVLEKGTLAQVGAPREVYHRPQSKFVADFIGESNFVTGNVKAADTNGSGTIETEIGTFTSNAIHADLKTGDQCLLCIRPESLVFRENAVNQLQATITDTMYLGEIGQWNITINDHPLKAFELQPAPREIGSQTPLHVDPDDVIVLPTAVK